MSTFEVGKWYRYLGPPHLEWRAGGNTIRRRVLDKKPRFCTAVDGAWCSFRSLTPNSNHPEGLWDWTKGLEHWQEVSISVVDDLIVYNCPKCGKPPKMETAKSSTISPISSYKTSQLTRTYSCCNIQVSGSYPHVLDAWNASVERDLEYKHFLDDLYDFMEKVFNENKKLLHKKEFSGTLKAMKSFRNKQYGG